MTTAMTKYNYVLILFTLFYFFDTPFSFLLMSNLKL